MPSQIQEEKKADAGQRIEQELIDFLKQGSFLTEAEIAEVKKEAESAKKSFENFLLEKQLIHDQDLGQIIADVHGWDYIDLHKEAIDEKVLQLIPEEMARTQEVIAFEETAETLKVAMSHPDDALLIHRLHKLQNKPVTVFYATPKEIHNNLYRYQTRIGEEFDRLIREESNEIQFADAKDSSVVKLVDLLLRHGYKKKASDIHIDPVTDETIIRFRIDGVMHDIVKIPLHIHEAMITRIKVMSRLRTDEHQAPQDGKIAFELRPGERADIRVSIVPTTKGENAVMRLLSEKSRQLKLEELGFSDHDFKKLSSAIKKPWGMILVTGPTGSGKTTTLYGVLQILNTSEVNIATIEDPVEFNIDGITQIQVNPKASLTFAAGLRSIVRQDPDIVMVGEIRDAETASIAVNSAMTGHLVLSTLHTNDAATALPRLLDMGMEPFLVSSTVNIIIAQRLLRRICQGCIVTHERAKKEMTHFPPDVMNLLFGEKETLTLFRGKGCSLCGGTGFSGRLGVYEVLEVSDPIRALVMKNTNADDLKKKAVEEGMTTMFDDAMEKVKSGMTTVEEMLRVVKN